MDPVTQTPPADPLTPTVAVTPPVETPAPKSELQQFRERKAALTTGEPAVPPVEPVTPATPAPTTVAAGEPVEPVEPSSDIPPANRFTDPDTGEVLDMRTRRAKRIKQLLSERVQTRSEVLQMREELARVRGQGPQEPAPRPASKAAPVVDPNDPEPQLESFAEEPDPYLAYTRSLARWEARQESREHDTRRTIADRARARQQQTTRAQAQWDAQLPDVRQRHPDFDQAYDAVFDALASVAQTGDTRHRYLVHRLLTGDHGHDLAYFLGTHPEEVQRLYQVRDFDQHVLAIGRLEERVVAGRQAPPVARSVIPPAPMTPVGGGATTTTYDPKTANLAQFRAQKPRLGLRG